MRTYSQLSVVIENLLYLVWLHVKFYLGKGAESGSSRTGPEWQVSEKERSALAKLCRDRTQSLHGLLRHKVRACTHTDLLTFMRYWHINADTLSAGRVG